MKESKKRMDTKKLHKITWKRAKPIVLSLGILLILISIFVGVNSTNNWHREQEFIHSQKARDQYNLYLEAQKTKENSVNNKYKETKDYQKSVDYAQNLNEGYILKFDSQTGKFRIKSQTLKEFYGYIRTKLFYTNSAQNLFNLGYIFTLTNVFQGFSLLSLFFIVVGFLITFLDYKTNFVLMLFSSGYKRKEILKSNIRTSLFPLILIAITAVGINLIILYSRIPHQYINYPLTKIIFYHVCLFLVSICYYFIGLISGIIFGQVFTGVASLIGFVFGAELIKQNLLDLLTILSHRKNDGIRYESFFVRFDTYPHWFILNSIVIIIILLLYFSSKYFYKRLSLEERGSYLLFPKFRLVISLVAGFFTSYSLFGNIGLTNEYGNITVNSVIRNSIIPAVLVFVITFCLFMVLNYYKRIYEKIGKKFIDSKNHYS